MEEQLIEIDSVADLRVTLEDTVGPDAVVNADGEVLPEEQEGEALDEVGDLAAGVFAEIDVGTPSRTADSISAMAGTSPRGTRSLLDNLSRRIVPSWLGSSGRGASRSDPVVDRHAQRHSRGGSRSARSVDRVPDSSGIPAHPRMYETPRNNGALSQGQARQEGRYTAHPGTLFNVPLASNEENNMTVSVDPVFTVPVSVEHSYAGRNVVQVSGPDVLSSPGAGFVGAGPLMPVPTGQAGTVAASAGISAVMPVQPEFLAGIQSTVMGHSVPNRLVSQTNADGLVYTAAAPMVSAGIGASVGVRLPASTPVDTSGPGMAGFIPFAARSLVNGDYNSPAYSSAVPNATGGVFPRATSLESAGAPQGVPGLARGTCPVNGSHVPAPPGAGAPPPGGPGVGTGTANGKQVKKVLMKLMTYDGTSSLETFLAKFARLAEYMRWDDMDQYYHLCASLEGIVGQVLWDAGPQATMSDVITLLRTRFRNKLQAERFKADLRARRHQPHESLQQLYLDISKLVALAYPASTPELSSHVAKEAFIEALNDPRLQLKVMEREPKLVEDALNIATRLEAYEASLQLRHQPKAVYTVEAEGEPEGRNEEIAYIKRQIGALETACADTWIVAQREEAKCQAAAAARAALAGSPPPSPVKEVAVPTSNSSRPQGSNSGHGKRRSQFSCNDVCRKCGQQGHWAKKCRNVPPPAPPSAARTQVVSNEPEGSQARNCQVVSTPEQPVAPPPVVGTPQAVAQVEVRSVESRPKRGWLQVEVQEKPVPCMVDLDTRHTVIGPAFVGHKRMKPSDVTETLVNRKAVTVVAVEFGTILGAMTWECRPRCCRMLKGWYLEETGGTAGGSSGTRRPDGPTTAAIHSSQLFLSC